MVFLNRDSDYSRSEFLACAMFLSLCAVIMYFPGLGGGFLFDDRANIVKNTALHLFQIDRIDDLLYAAYSFEPGGSSRPLAMLSFAFDFWRSGLDPSAFKMTNLTIHFLNSVFVTLLVRQVLLAAGWLRSSAQGAALMISFLWAIHPLQVSSVLYVVQRMQILSTLFVLLALLAYMVMRKKQIEGESGRLFGFVMVLCGVLAFSCKEDAILLPLYFLSIELTVLKFRAADNILARRIKALYTVFFVSGLALYVIVVLPYFWRWEDYAGRDFNSLERLLTQARVLVNYLWQIVYPLPGNMPFIYDNIAVSQSLIDPGTTLLSVLLVALLFCLAWVFRRQRPLFSLGIFLFLGGHFVTSNVIGLELVFEHRNYFPLLGVVIALADLLVLVYPKGVGWFRAAKVLLVVVLLSLGSSLMARTYIWGDQLRLAQYTLEVSPDSERAWLFLCVTRFELSGLERDRSKLNLAISDCRRGADQVPDSAILMSNVITYKAISGVDEKSDWDEFLGRLKKVKMSAQNQAMLWTAIGNVERGVISNKGAVLEMIEIYSSKKKFNAFESLRIAAYIFNYTDEPVKAYPYLERAVRLSEPDDGEIKKVFSQLSSFGLEEWVSRLEEVQHQDENGVSNE